MIDTVLVSQCHSRKMRTLHAKHWRLHERPLGHRPPVWWLLQWSSWQPLGVAGLRRFGKVRRITRWVLWEIFTFD